ncbi:MAG: HlyD family secretion protein [Acidobacteriaceae bacterium]|nr:HlyD family secretion protein [Acidobacteriaceae bacterium]
MKLRPLTRWSALAAALAVIILIGFALSRSRLAIASDGIPLAQVKRGDLDLKVHASGELNATHTMMLAAPAVGGGSLQITRLLAGRLPVKKGDVVIEFDPSEQRYKLEQSRSELLQAEQEITKAKADAAVLKAQDKVALLKAHYDVRKAELDVQKKEIVSAIDAAKNDAALKQAKQLLAELERDIESHNKSGQASVYLAQEKYNKSKLEMDQAQQNIDKMSVTAPMDGLISIQKNMDASGGFFFTGMSVPDYHAGDQAQAGSAIAQVVDPTELELKAKISERNRGNVKQGQSVDVVFDALPGRAYHARVKQVGGMSTRQFFEDNAGGTFDVTMQLSDADAPLHSGMTAQLLFLGDTRRDVFYLPRQAVFLKDGKHIVYLKSGKGYEQKEIEIKDETESRAVIEGLSDGTSIAMIDPTLPRKQQSAPATPGGGTP